MAKTYIRTIDGLNEDNAHRLRDKLRKMGFYVLTGDAHQLEIYAIEKNEYWEEKLQKITDDVVAKYGGCVVYTQWAPIMKRILSTVSILASLMFTGCHHSKHVADGAHVANLNGVWSATVTLDGLQQHLSFIIIQTGATVTNESLVYADGSGINGHVSGGVADNDMTLTVDEGTLCTNKMHADAELQGATLQVHITGAGNSVSGSSCYNHAIDLTAAMTH